ncbi:oligosaccharide flippase family protein [Turicibacter bilis]|uniref:lipopolysaccharide biosynthesis protein n=1 Tax=Turicibacter bilis TaxID=2735723 RepID=UPI001BB034EA|nr:oligosaccharide flippase family protein [Turicibacter bilis]MBS3203736.1 oligosaccharide flippase family protein [Turicibacter bilis]UUF11099.1 oligosaccharide flippase family protein [Turicibacter bilis]
MRTANSIKNIYITLLTQIIITLLGFISRKVFLDSLGTEYLGVNGLLTNVLSMLSLVEGGIGLSITYNFYKPLAENNEKKLTALVQLYKKLYGILAVTIFILSLALYPFLGYLMNGDVEVPWIGLIYFILVLKNMISYLNAHKWSLINADQKGYILAKYNLMFNVFTTISKIIVLLMTHNYILYLIIEAVIFIIQNLWNGKVVNEIYPYLKNKEKYKVDQETKNNLITNVKALFLHNIGEYCVFGTDNIIISTFISIKAVGLYSNYTMIIGQLSSLLTPALSGVGASVGNLIATEGKNRTYDIFKVINLVNFWIYSLCVIFLINLLEPFINWWLGEGLLLDRLTFIVVLINFYIKGMRSSISTFKSKAGIFHQDRYIPLVEAALNLGSSLILVRYFGLAGIFMGTTISSLLIPVWTQSKLVYNHVFNKSVFEYFKSYVFFIGLTILVGTGVTSFCTALVPWNGFSALVVKGLICVIVTNLTYLGIFFRTEEFQYLWGVFQPIFNKMKYKLLRIS